MDNDENITFAMAEVIREKPTMSRVSYQKGPICHA